MNQRRLSRVGGLTFAVLVSLAGCRPRSETPAPAAVPDLDASAARASELKRPMLVLITEAAKGGDDESARRLLDPSTLGGHADRIVSILLDLGVSRNRATVARFHALETPVLFCLSPGGVILSRDEKPLAKDLVLKRIDESGPLASELDAKLAELREPVAKDPADVTARLALADFWQGHENMREAIPHLSAVAHSDRADQALQIRAWVDLAKAFLWVIEPEKARSEAKALVDKWGSEIPEARAGGNLVLGSQDARQNRIARARQEFREAIAAAPDSAYARQAREELAGLPEEEKQE